MTNTVHLDPAWPMSLRRWLIGNHKLAVQFVNTSCDFTPQRAEDIRTKGVATDVEVEIMRTFFNCSKNVIVDALIASRRHHSELALLS